MGKDQEYIHLNYNRLCIYVPDYRALYSLSKFKQYNVLLSRIVKGISYTFKKACSIQDIKHVKIKD